MKRGFRFFIIAFIVPMIVISFCACSNRESISASQSGLEATVGATEDKYQAFMELEAERAKYKNGFYEIVSLHAGYANIAYTDFETAQQVYVCSRPECEHDNESCTSYIEQQGFLPPSVAVLSGQQLLLISGPSDSQSTRFTIANMDGSGRRTLAELEANQTMVMNACTDGNYLIFDMREIDKDGNETLSLMELDLETGALAILCGLNDGSAYYQLESAAGEKLCFLHIDMQVEKNNASYCLFEPSLRNLEEPFFSFTAGAGDAVMSGEFLLTIDHGTNLITRKNVLTQEEIMVPFTPVQSEFVPSLWPQFNEMVFLEQVVPKTDEEPDSNRYYIDFEKRETIQVLLETAHYVRSVPVVGKYNDKLCVISDFVEHELLFEDQDGTMQTTQYVTWEYSMIDFEDYLHSKPNYQKIRMLTE